MQVKLTFIRQWGGSDRIVWIDTARLNSSWRRDRSYYLPRGVPNRTAAWIVRLNYCRIPMPHVSLDEKGVVSFTDGRHRFAWFRDHGVEAIPVTAPTRKEAELIKRKFGSRRRTVRMLSSEFPHP
jgi:hypothetical protein